MNKSLLVAILLIFATFNAKASDLTEFDYPLLLGDWYWFSNTDEGVESEGASYRAMNVKFKSDYRFVIRLLQVDGSVDEWSGIYDIDETTVTFRSRGQPEQQHSYMLSYNQFLLDGARFTKLAPENLPGNWRSAQISGQDVGDAVSELSISLRPDFLFSAEVSGKDGKKKEHRGIYYIEDDRIVLIYEDGQQDSQFSLGSDTLTLTNKQFGMEAVMRRE
ncbi:WD40 repeat protein [Photobacterium aquae]|uniref:WD40 repeat protein n=1 Tax=Photobacterium aquae TaxID=1195763 RepID=A0A0J1GVS2_9GAMM|nr:lipocalin family protein [Photobacterium aquae]KLV03780.1 WD40 repeat protein [Photobacterium aquae]